MWQGAGKNSIVKGVMRVFKKIALGLLILFVLIQFIPRSVNKSMEILSADIMNKYQIPVEVQSVLKNTCYDCHSNNTTYPWYARVQPFRLILDRHIKNGKEELNFSEFGNYSAKKQFNKLNSIGESIKKETMPLKSYQVMHAEAKLTLEEKDEVLKWIEDTRNEMKRKKE